MPKVPSQTVNDVADRLKVAATPVRRWIKDGNICAIYIGKGWRFADLDQGLFLARHQTTAGVTTSATQTLDR